MLGLFHRPTHPMTVCWLFVPTHTHHQDSSMIFDRECVKSPPG